MRKCTNCNTLNDAEDLFCGVCGTKLEDEEDSSINFCSKCKNPVTQEDAFCGECGARNETINAPTSESTPSEISGTVNKEQGIFTAIEVSVPMKGESAPKPFVVEQPVPPIERDEQPKVTSPPPIKPIVRGKTLPAEPEKKALVPLFVVAGAIFAIIVLMIASIFAILWYQNNSFGKKIEKALTADQIFSPPGDCVVDLVAAEKSKDPSSKKITEIASGVKSKIEPQAEKTLQAWYKDSDQTTNWDNLEKQYGLLNSVLPDDKDIAAKYFYCSGQKSIKSNNYEKARDLYLKAIEDKPNWALPLNGLGKVYIRDDSPFKNPETAVNYYKKAVEVDPHFTWSYTNLANYYKQKGNLATAKDYMQKAINSYPTKSSLFIQMGNICVKMGNNYEANWYFQKALEYETDEPNKEKLRKAIEATSQSEEVVN